MSKNQRVYRGQAHLDGIDADKLEWQIIIAMSICSIIYFGAHAAYYFYHAAHLVPKGAL